MLCSENRYRQNGGLKFLPSFEIQHSEIVTETQFIHYTFFQNGGTTVLELDCHSMLYLFYGCVGFSRWTEDDSSQEKWKKRHFLRWCFIFVYCIGRRSLQRFFPCVECGSTNKFALFHQKQKYRFLYLYLKGFSVLKGS